MYPLSLALALLIHNKQQPGMVGRHAHPRAEQDRSAEPSGDRVGVPVPARFSHGTRIEHGTCGQHREDSGVTDGM
jgi:hypothetical protein